MTDYTAILEASVEQGVAVASAQVALGQRAAVILADPLIAGFFTDRTNEMVKALLDCDPTDTETIRVIAIGIKALRGLHDHLTQAVTGGLTAASRLNEQSSQGETK